MMKRALALLLTMALMFSASVAFASSIGLEDILSQSDLAGFPNLDDFAVLHASVPDKDGRVTVTLSKPVDRIWANWMGACEKPEELFLNNKLSVTFSTKDHPYQVGALPPSKQDLYKDETSKRYDIDFGAEQSQIVWRTIQANDAALPGHCVEVVEPHWLLVRISDDSVVDSYSDKLVSGDIKVPEGYRLQKVEGYAVAWQYGSNGSDGSPNLAYITVQNGYVVIYSRNGKIQYVTKYEPGMHVFGVDVGPTRAESEQTLAISGYYVPGRISEFEGLPTLPPMYTFAGITPAFAKDGTITLNLTKPVDRIWYCGQGEPQELHAERSVKIVITTDGGKVLGYNDNKTPAEMTEKVYSYRQPIVWGGTDSHVNWAINQAKKRVGPDAAVKVVKPHWELVEISTGRVIREYPDTVNCTEINVPNGYTLRKMNGYAEAYYTLKGADTTGLNNVAYITEQNGWTVMYTRGGKIVGVSIQVPGTNFFNTTKTGTATIQYRLSEYGTWYVSEVKEVYPDNTSITATFSRYGNGKLDDYQVVDL